MVRSTSGNSKPPSAFQIPLRMCTVRIAVVITAAVSAVPSGVNSPDAIRKPPPTSPTSAGSLDRQPTLQNAD